MRILIGLGNPEGEYRGTRHNVGFDAINFLSGEKGIPVAKYKRAFRAYLGEGVINGEPVILAKPQTYMNHSGEAVGALLHFYKLPPSELIIVCDDISLPVGDIRVRAQGSAGGHNGLKSIISHLGTDVFTRVKIGVGDKPEGWDLADWVLSRFRKDEAGTIEKSVERAGGAVLEILREGVAAVMNRYNKRIQNESL